MEILSVGEKIKRARIYQGITLKELCGNKISLSKMSCIENNKVKAEEEILQYIANKLKMDYNYLSQDIKSQLIKNIDAIDEYINTNINDLNTSIKYNLNYAIENDYIDIAFKLLNKLFNIYLSNNNEDIQDLIVQYTDLHKRNNSGEESIMYYKDMGEFYFKNREFNEAIYYLSKIKGIFDESKIIDKKEYIIACYKISLSYKELNYIEEAYKELESVINDIESIENKNDIADAYTLFISLKILFKKEYSEDLFEKAIKFYDEDTNNIINSKLKLVQSYFEVGYFEEGKKELEDILKTQINKEVEYYPELLLKCINILYENSENNMAEEFIGEALNLAIYSNKPNLVENAYYLKGMILQKQGRYNEAENCMNIAIDSRIKFASREEKYIIYNEMGELYYNLGEYKEAVKYFSPAVNEKNKLGKVKLSFKNKEHY